MRVLPINVRSLSLFARALCGRQAILIVFLFCVTPGVLGSVFLTPPFQIPDEPSHFLRAIQVSQGGMRGVKGGELSGGNIPAGIPLSFACFDNITFHTDHHVQPQQMKCFAAADWSYSRVLTGFANTVTYGPLGYLPQAIGVLLGQALNLSVSHTFYLSRLLNGLCFITLAACAIALAQRARLFLALVLSLPMCSFLAASVSQDGLLIAISALLSAALSRFDDRISQLSVPMWLTFGLGFGLLGMAKPPDLALSLIACCMAPRKDLTRSLLCPVLATALTLLWLWLGVEPVKIQFMAERGVSDLRQLHYLAAHPLVIPALVSNTVSAFGEAYCAQFIGVLGWLDTSLPRWFIKLTAGLLVIFLALGLSPALMGASNPLSRQEALIALLRKGTILLCILAACVGIFVSLYVIWNKVGAGVIEGVQGRYFLPIAPFLTLLFPQAPSTHAQSKLQVGICGMAVLTFVLWLPVALVTYDAVLWQRYW